VIGRSRAIVGLAVAAWLVVLVATPVTRSAAQVTEPAVEVTTSFREAAATIGDRVELIVAVTHPEDVVVTVQRPVFPDAEVVSDGTPTVLTQADAMVLTTATFTYQVFALGEVGTSPVTVRWVREDGTSGSLTAPGATLNLLSVRAAGDETLRPLKPVLTIEGAPPAWIVPAVATAAVAAIAGLIAAGVVAWRRRRPVEVVAAVPILPEEVARERLAAIRDEPLRDEADFQRFYGGIASIVRDYLGARFAFNAHALTTGELERRMTSHGVDRWQARLVSGLLDRCDRAVYARRYPDPASADHDLTVAYEIVALSSPREPDAEPEAVAS
jgi:hypothetical protein